MQRRQFFSQLLVYGFAAGSVSCVTGCATIFHPERRGQISSNQIDWKMAALDGLGLLLFFVPGVVAFAVDFSTGAIYLPLEPCYPGYGTGPQPQPPPAEPRPAVPPAPPAMLPKPPDSASADPRGCQPTWQELGLQQVVIPREELQQQRIEQVVTNHTGQQVSLDDGQARLSPLPSIERFDEQAHRLQSDHTFGFAVKSFFARLRQA
jgi:hypothetical protein